MKTFNIEIENYELLKKPHELSRENWILTAKCQNQIDLVIADIRKISTRYPNLHLAAQALPIILILLLLFLLSFSINSLSHNLWINIAVYSILHGVLSYQFVIYTLHEGAGHGLFRKYVWLNRIAFNLSRLFFADPNYYKKKHVDHHRYLGTSQDGAFTHFVLPHRIIKSMLPGAGVIYSNDYKIAQPDKPTNSTFVSFGIGLLVVAFQIFLLAHTFPVWLSLLSLLVVSPWISMLLDRTRESIEHCNMPNDLKMGSWELGLSMPALLIGGGPWGQPCHFSHHLAPELNWYQQILLHKKLLTILSKEVAQNYGFGVSVFKRIYQVFKFYQNFYLSKKSKELL